MQENDPYGFIPGEAAGFVLLASAAAAERYKLPAALELLTAADRPGDEADQDRRRSVPGRA